MLVRLIVCLAILLITTTARAQERIALIGDSQAFLLQRHLEPLVRQQGHAWLSLPVPGSSIIMWAELKTARWDIRKQWAQLAGFRPTTVVVLLGSNDSYMGCRIIANEPPYLQRLQRRLNRLGAHTVWIGPPDLERARPGLDCLYQMVPNPAYQLVDSRQLALTFWDDRLHPDQAGQVEWAGWIWNKLKGDEHAGTSVEHEALRIEAGQPTER